MSVTAGQSTESHSTDVLKKHHSKSATPVANRLPDPRTMAEIRDGLEDISEAGLVCNDISFLLHHSHTV